MTIKIFVFNYLTHTVEIDSTIEVNGDYQIAEANHKAFRELYPNCQVNFVIDNDNFMMSPPLNQQKDEAAYDEGRMTWDEYMSKWYQGALESDDDIRDTIDRMEEEDFASRDAVCF
jgi:hypothetical protein